MFMEVILTGSTSQCIGLKLTCDAARLMRAPKAYKVCTTCILQLLCYAETRGDWGDMVKHMVELPQSCKRAFKTRLIACCAVKSTRRPSDGGIAGD